MDIWPYTLLHSNLSLQSAEFVHLSGSQYVFFTCMIYLASDRRISFTDPLLRRPMICHETWCSEIIIQARLLSFKQDYYSSKQVSKRVSIRQSNNIPCVACEDLWVQCQRHRCHHALWFLQERQPHLRNTPHAVLQPSEECLERPA